MPKSAPRTSGAGRASGLSRKAALVGDDRWLERPVRVYVPYDQLTDAVGPLASTPPTDLGILLVESRGWLSRRPYHRQKLAAVLLNQRAFALEQAERGVAVRVVVSDEPIAAVVERERHGDDRILCMRPAERELRAELARVPLVEVPNETWLTTPDDLDQARTTSDDDEDEFAWRMDRFYRAVRRRTGLLMEAGKPVGGKFSFDAENRRRWEGTPPAPTPPRFERTALREEVEREILERFAAHPGTLDVEAMPATKADAARLWRWAKDSCLEHFGPYEDAMSRKSRGLFHTRITPILNLARLLPKQLVADVAAMNLPLASKEGFLRQVIGWREFVHQVHDATDGFRSIGRSTTPCSGAPGDGGYERWAGKAWPTGAVPGVDGGATPSRLAADLPLPPAWWGRPSGLACLDRVVADVWAEGWSHHITRLMVLSNLATLLGVRPRELTDWFWVAYADAFDWVVEPNVLGMGTYAVGGLLTTKPYVSGAAYIDGMSDYCSSCRFDPRSTCPITSLYWNFLRTNSETLSGNRRLALPLASMRSRGPERHAHDERVFVHVRDVLVRGERLEPESMPTQPAASSRRAKPSRSR
jgi:deoxyribodipyrimidine photolyase-related protein